MPISTFNGLNIALRGLLAQQQALDTTTHNIANVNTEGYTRQEAVLEAEQPLANVSVWGMQFPGQIGQGVTVASYRRIRDVFNDSQLRNATSQQSSLDVQYRELHGITLAMPEPSDTGLQALVQKFFSAWHDVANSPESIAARQALAQSAQSLTTAINAAASSMANARTNDNSELDSGVSDVNTITAQIATLNQQIGDTVLAGAQLDPTTGAVVKPGQSPNDLLDKRDRLLDDLAKHINVTSVTYDDQQRATVVVAGIAVVTPGSGATPITRAQVDTAFSSGALTGGSLHGLETAYSGMLDEANPTSYASQLNTLAQSLHDSVNVQHALGLDLAGQAGAQFFDMSSPTGPPGAASRLIVASAILANPSTIAAAAAGEGPGSSGNANAIIALQKAVTTGATTFSDFYNGMQSSLGTATAGANASLGSQAIIVNGLTDRRTQSSGVSLDEEMSNMIRFQHAYSAAARVLSAMDDNLSKLINSTGRVGL
jgi:flagellar hook-associated protein 1 FlgK